MATGVISWSQTAASNNSSDSTVNWAEGQAASTVNDSARAMMASVAKYRDDLAGNITTGGTSTAYTVTSNQVQASNVNGFQIAFKPHTDCGAAPTLSVDGQTARALVPYHGGTFAAGGLVSGAIYTATYNTANSEWVVAGGNLAPYFGTQTDLASAGTTDLGTIASKNVNITGTTTITAFGSSASISAPIYLLKFAASLTLTYNATSLILPTAADIKTGAGDTAIATYLGSGNWRVIDYRRASSTPTVQRFTSGSGTYTPANGCTLARVKIVGGGGGGGAAVTNSGNTGGTTTFGSWTAIGGAAGQAGSAGTTVGSGTGGTGGATGTGTAIVRNAGNIGGFGVAGSNSGGGAAGPWGGGAQGKRASSDGSTGAGYGSGGSGGYTSGSGTAGGGGGSGEYVEFFVSSPAATSYSVGAGGNGGSAGTQAGGTGAAGVIIVEEY